MKGLNAMYITGLASAEDIREYVMAGRHESKGVICPSCDRLAKVYHYSLNSGQARCLVGMYYLTKKFNPEDGWIHITKAFAQELNLNANTLAYTRLSFWGMLEPARENPDPTKNASGLWRLTDKGTQFVEGRITVPRSVIIYSNTLLGVSDDTTDIETAVDNKFNYQELMGGL